MAGTDIATITVNGKESKMQVATLLGILNSAASCNIDARTELEGRTLGELTACRLKGVEEESVRNALLNLIHYEEELELIDSITTELGIRQ